MPYRLREGSIHEKFFHSRSKIQVMGGGFGNGKSAAVCMKALEIARAYPGSNGLIGRSTFPRLRDTVMKEFKKWCPPEWIKKFPESENSSKTCTLINGSEINFRYVQQKGKGDDTGETKSNLLSATYDYVIIDQIEDPEITHKDFLDLMGRLRGNTNLDRSFKSDLLGSHALPLTGPRWFMPTLNPTRNWAYKHLIRPIHDFREGKYNEHLICLRDKDGKIVTDKDGLPIPLIDLVEGSTYENRENLGEDFIQGLESTYTGQMRDRFLLGQWSAYEGLVYPQYVNGIHSINHETMKRYFMSQKEQNKKLTVLESFDFGIAVESCYLFGFVDMFGNVCVLDGFYKRGETIEQMLEQIKTIRKEYLGAEDYEASAILADPQLFRRTASSKTVAGTTVADLFYDNGKGVTFVRAANNIIHGIAKVSSYLALQKYHPNPFTQQFPSPYLYFSDKLAWLDEEFQTYMWHKDTSGNDEDKPIDKKDHAMDALKYLLTYRPKVSEIKVVAAKHIPAYMRGWFEQEVSSRERGHRYGRNTRST